METAGCDSSRPLAEQVAQRIKDYILEEKLKSGDKLPTETAIAREMGVARSTVREAIKRLESQNILTVRHGAQYESEGWYTRIDPNPESDSPVSEAIMDRIIHNAYEVLVDGRVSMRERKGLKATREGGGQDV